MTDTSKSQAIAHPQPDPKVKADDIKKAVEVVSDDSASTAEKNKSHELIKTTADDAKKAESFKPAKPEAK